MAETKKKPAADPVAAVTDKIAEWPEPYREIGERIHKVVLDTVPELQPRLFYGMPGYAKAKSTPVLIFVRLDDGAFSFGISEKAHRSLEDGATDQLIPTAWTLDAIDDATEARIAEIVKKAAG